jgi:purine-nucleoside phosphorylase
MLEAKHIGAAQGEIAQTVLLPGDPLRAQFIAEHFLEDAKRYTEIRGMYGFTGSYKGKRISVQGTGMGAPSMGIYAYELIHAYGVRNLIRIGTAGALQDDMALEDVVIGMSASYDTAIANQYGTPGVIAPTAAFPLLHLAYSKAQALQIPVRVGNIFSSDLFYHESGLDSLLPWKKMGALAVEMESASLYLTAQRAGVQALCIITISDLPFSGASSTAMERQTAFTRMMQIALETAIEA